MYVRPTRRAWGRLRDRSVQSSGELHSDAGLIPDLLVAPIAQGASGAHPQLSASGCSLQQWNVPSCGWRRLSSPIFEGRGASVCHLRRLDCPRERFGVPAGGRSAPPPPPSAQGSVDNAPGQAKCNHDVIPHLTPSRAVLALVSIHHSSSRARLLSSDRGTFAIASGQPQFALPF